MSANLLGQIGCAVCLGLSMRAVAVYGMRAVYLSAAVARRHGKALMIGVAECDVELTAGRYAQDTCATISQQSPAQRRLTDLYCKFVLAREALKA